MATVDITESTFEAMIDSDSIVLLDCWASWCGPCRTFGPIFEKVSENHPDMTFAKLDTELHQVLAGQLQIQSIPTVMIFREGIMVFRHSGVILEAALEDLIKQVQALDMDDVRQKASIHEE